MMQHPMENRIPYPPFGISHCYPTFPLPHKPQVLHQCPATKNYPHLPSSSPCHPTPASPSGAQETSSPPKPSQRPFKAISKGHHEFRNFLYNDRSFQEYRSRMLSNLSPNNELCTSMRRLPQRDMSRIGDSEYLAKRKKNNEAAKRSREARKMKEDELAVRCAFLEQENLQLKVALAALENETRRLRSVLLHPVSNSG